MEGVRGREGGACRIGKNMVNSGRDRGYGREKNVAGTEREGHEHGK